MGKASNRKKQRRLEREADRNKFRIVVCASPDLSVLPALELLKSAVIYGDEVTLHQPTATLMAGLAEIDQLSPAQAVELMMAVAPNLS
ncbi:MAG: hypothetical protein OEY70_09645, partial [Acidimicrobiia bacterium]|nr:hypothetical protein [Acidimicrobiia bacterium]